MKQLAMLACTILLLGGCATYQGTTRSLDALSQRYAQFDLLVGWDVKAVDGSTVISGVVKNVRYLYMEDLEIWVEALDPAGKVTARAVSFVIPHQLPQDQSAEFALKLPVAVAPGSKLRFTYKYLGNDGAGSDGGGGGGVNWWQSFEAVVPAR
jgi:hypothetical protein